MKVYLLRQLSIQCEREILSVEFLFLQRRKASRLENWVDNKSKWHTDIIRNDIFSGDSMQPNLLKVFHSRG